MENRARCSVASFDARAIMIPRLNDRGDNQLAFVGSEGGRKTVVFDEINDRLINECASDRRTPGK